MDESQRLIEGAAHLGLALSMEQALTLLRLLDELEHWNHAHNLTAIRARPEMLTLHLLDSLSVHSDLTGSSIADVGTGAGFPGLPLAVANPQRRFTLIDSNGKKVRFVSHAVSALNLTNVAILQSRSEALRPEKPYDTVVARAFAPLPQLLENIEPLCDASTHVLAMKGRRPDEELARLDSGWRVLAVRPLAIPGLDAQRHVVVLQRA